MPDRELRPAGVVGVHVGQVRGGQRPSRDDHRDTAARTSGVTPAEPFTTRGNEWQRLTAGAFVSIIIPVIVFLSMQRHFVRGLPAGSVKGAGREIGTRRVPDGRSPVSVPALPPYRAARPPSRPGSSA
ncbi:hypothetical protein GCM10010468_06900 [Actinocorallia longicatena]|uniref:Uncharacterized protein n=1 Tax=Actinocorallia longicatena TaxID=111803 RepID=A0ABP6PYH2_9ACTN